MNGPIPLTWVDLAIAATLVLINGALSAWLRLGLEKKLVVASLRTIVQLTVLGYVLVPVFSWGHWGPVAAICLMMVVLAGRTAVKRASRTYRGIQVDAFGSLLVGGGVTVLLGTAVIIDVQPWWEPQYLIPLFGMILNNALTGISLGLDRCVTLLDDSRERVELLLARGATAWEAARPIAAEAIGSGMVPILNSMSVVGLVAIPGMMTGQILGGTPPEQAARYQVLIMFLIAGSTAIGVAGSVLLAVRRLFDDQARLRTERLVRR